MSKEFKEYAMHPLEAVGLYRELQRLGPKALIDHMLTNYPDLAYVDLPLGRQPMVFISSPRLADAILVDNHDSIAKNTRDFRILRESLPSALIPTATEAWVNRRRLILPAFNHHRIAEFLPVMAEHAKESLSNWESRSTTGSIILDQELAQLTVNIITNFLFGQDARKEAAGITADVGILAKHFSNRVAHFGWPPLNLPLKENQQFHQAWERLYRVLGKMVDMHTGTNVGDNENLLSALLEARDEETNQLLPKEEIIEEMLAMLIAGHETTAIALTWSLILLNEHPDVAMGVKKDIHMVLGGRAPTMEDLKQLSSVNWVIREAMRLYPPVWVFSRKAANDFSLPNGLLLPKGMNIIISPLTMHRHPDYWNKPNEFIPARFDNATSTDRHTEAWRPFGAGRRRCLGAELALTEAALILTTILAFHDVRILEKARPALLVTTRPDKPVAAKILPISS
ncbi:cytochrome P450 [Candidatus Gottesmanbacteria bacterium]|nr:cytochrome P450 [Candidatus Gottesmanbacteria bacterium]